MSLPAFVLKRLTQPMAVLATVIGFSLSLVRIDAAEGEGSRPIEQSVRRLDSSGTIHSLQPMAREDARVFVFLTGECPIAKSYLPVLNRLSSEWTSREPARVTLHAVWADPTTAPAKVSVFVKEHEILFPVLLDRDGELARRFKPTHVPEAFVLDSEGRLVYRGRIDDTFPELGRRRLQSTQNNLADAVAAVLESKPVAVAQTEPVGCVFETAPSVRNGSASVTYTRDIAPILFANCVICHRAGEVGPFPLTSYEDAAKRARQIARVTGCHLMPPWMPTETHGEFEEQRTLTDQQIETLATWATGDRAEGNADDMPAAPHFVAGWRLGNPDLILEMPDEFQIPADGPDIYQNFVIPIDIPSDKLVAAVDFIPGNPTVVHHALLFLDARHIGRTLDAKTPEPGYGRFGDPGFLPTGSIGGWSLGKTPRRLPDGLGRYLQKGSDLVMQVHYHPTGKRETDRSKVGVYFVERPKNVAADIWASAFTHDIPAGEKNYRMTASYTLPKEMLMLGVVPHMHLLGRSMRAVAKLPDGSERQLVDIPRWNFNWQDDYRFARPFKLPQGTRLEVEAVYDNSEDNPQNPSHPPQHAYWGEGTTDEMLYCFFFVAADNQRELLPVLTDVITREVIGKRQAKRLK